MGKLNLYLVDNTERRGGNYTLDYTFYTNDTNPEPAQFAEDMQNDNKEAYVECNDQVRGMSSADVNENFEKFFVYVPDFGEVMCDDIEEQLDGDNFRRIP